MLPVNEINFSVFTLSSALFYKLFCADRVDVAEIQGWLQSLDAIFFQEDNYAFVHIYDKVLS